MVSFFSSDNSWNPAVISGGTANVMATLAAYASTQHLIRKIPLTTWHSLLSGPPLKTPFSTVIKSPQSNEVSIIRNHMQGDTVVRGGPLKCRLSIWQKSAG